MSIAILPMVILIGVAVAVGAVLAIARARHPWRWVLGLVGAFLIVLISIPILHFATWGVPRPTLSHQTGPVTSRYSSSGSAGEQINIGKDGLSVRSGHNKIVIDGRGLSMTDGQSSMHISGNGVVMKQDRTGTTSSVWTTDRERAAQAEALAAEKARQAREQARAAAAEAEPRAINRARTATAERQPAVQPDQWIDAGQMDFEANVYPSERSAAVAIAKRMIKSWSRTLPADQEPKQVLVSGDSELEPDVVPAVIQALRASLGDSRVDADKTAHEPYLEHVETEILPFFQGAHDHVSATSAPAHTEADTTLHLIIAGDFTYAYGGRGVIPSSKNGGNLNLSFTGPSGKSTGTAAFVNKPWVERGIDRASQQPGQEQMIARSNGLCASRGEAEQKAIADAANKVIPLVRAAIERLENDRRNDPSIKIKDARTIINVGRSDAELRDGIRAEMLRGTGINDQFTQQFRRPYGDVWQQALLVDASDGQLTRYAQLFLPQMIREQESAVRQRLSWIRTGGSLVLLTMLIAVVYVFLNAATRGYYTWALRGSMVVLVLAGAVLLLFMV